VIFIPFAFAISLIFLGSRDFCETVYKILYSSFVFSFPFSVSFQKVINTTIVTTFLTSGKVYFLSK